MDIIQLKRTRTPYNRRPGVVGFMYYMLVMLRGQQEPYETNTTKCEFPAADAHNVSALLFVNGACAQVIHYPIDLHPPQQRRSRQIPVIRGA